MPVTSSAKKALRRDRARKIVNLKVKKAFRGAIKAFKKNPSQKNLLKAHRQLDKAAKKKVIHKNKASRLKSRLTKK